MEQWKAMAKPTVIVEKMSSVYRMVHVEVSFIDEKGDSFCLMITKQLLCFIKNLCICNWFEVAPLMVYQVTEKNRGRVALDSFAHQTGYAQVTIVKIYVKLLIDITTNWIVCF